MHTRALRTLLRASLRLLIAAALLWTAYGGPITNTANVAHADPALTASFTAQVNADGSVQFTDTSSSPAGITAWAWTFGDSGSAAAQHPLHSYAAAGAYPVSLTVTDADGDTATASGSVTVAPQAAMTCDFTLTASGTTVPVTVNFGNTSQNASGYSWDFEGNGSTDSTDTSPSYTYTTAGTYNITLTCTGALGTQTASGQITISDPAPPPQNPTASFDVQINADGSAQFTDTSSGPAAIVAWAWTFGDGNGASSQHPLHSYAAAGTYPVSLTVTDANNNTATANGSVTLTPQVVMRCEFTMADNGTIVPVTVNFTNLSQEVTSYAWDFDGNGSTDSTDTSPSYIYTAAGTYDITLTCTGAQGTLTVTGQITIADAPIPAPTPEFTYAPTIGQAPLAVTLADASTGNITTWAWTFGDGDSFTGQNPGAHTYNTPGTYTITLSVTGPGGTQSISKQVIVAGPGSTVQADFAYTLMGNTPGGIEVCFDNLSQGPVSRSVWTFGDGQTADFNPDSTPPQRVCHTYANGGNFSVTLQVYGLTPDVTSTATRNVSVIAAPTALFTASAAQITWGSGPVQFTNQSSGAITAYEWDFDGDGSVDSSDEHPSYTFPLPGLYTVTLTAIGPGGRATYTMQIEVLRLEITCSYSGAVNVTPGQAVTYSATVNNVAGRGITYGWLVSPGGQNGAALAFPMTWATAGSYTLTFEAATDDGSTCAVSKTVTVAWPAITCALDGDFDPAPNGQPSSYTATVNNLAGRGVSYQWYADGNPVGSDSAALSHTWGSEGAHTVRVVATASDSTTCESSHPVTVAWPALVCTVGGNTAPVPAMPDNPTRSYTYTANVTADSLAGRSINSYTWYVNGAAVSGQTGSTLNLSWDWDEEGPYTIRYEAVTSDGTGDCNPALNVTVNLLALACGAPGGDTTPVVGERVTYTPALSNAYGRTPAYAWTLEQLVSGVYTTVAAGTGGNLAYTFNEAGAQYRVTYQAAVTNPDEGCSGTRNITVAGTGLLFTCDGWRDGTWAPTSSTTDYRYRVWVDNTNRYNLTYDWSLIGPSGSRLLTSFVSNADGSISAIFNGALFAPADSYTLHVDVSSAALGLTCPMEHALTVGQITAAFAVNKDRLAVNEQVCLTNQTTNSHGSPDELVYSWDFGNGQTSRAQHPGCLSYGAAGTYTITLRAANVSGTQTSTATRTVRVFDLQSIGILHSGGQFAPANWSFTAQGVNLFPDRYVWEIFNQAGARLVRRTGPTASYYFLNPGTYRVLLTGEGELGVISAEQTFTLYSESDIRAAFTPSRWHGIAPMTVSFHDESIGLNITSWQWEFGDGQTSSAQHPTITFSQPGSYAVRLTVRNAAGTATATNTVHVYTLAQTNATFNIIHLVNLQYRFAPAATITVLGWDFGDGTVSFESAPDHSFPGPGVYEITMLYQDEQGGTRAVRRTIGVSNQGLAAAPHLVADPASCDLYGSAVFTVRNDGSANMAVPTPYEVQDAAGAVVASGTVQLAIGESAQITVPGVYGPLTLRTDLSDANTSLVINSDCAQPLGSISGQAQVDNNSDRVCGANDRYMGGVMVRLLDASGSEVATTQTAADGSYSFSNLPAGVYTLAVDSSTLPAGATLLANTLTQTLAPGGSLNLSLCYVVPAPSGGGAGHGAGAGPNSDASPDVTPAPVAASQPDTGAASSVAAPAGAAAAPAGPAATSTATGTATSAAVTQPASSAPAAGLYRPAAAQGTVQSPLRLPLLGGSTLALGNPDRSTISGINAWESIPACDRACVPFQLYHSNQTGNWEIFRLGELPGHPGANPNLSQGEGQGLDDMAPSLSPNGEWIAFTSNRDGNWELYIAPTDGDSERIQRVTFNRIALDTDPAWGPNNSIVYESTRDGNWELYLFDVTTGQETRLTDDPAAEVNAFWSPDGSRLVFQSDRGGLWQVYEMTLATGGIRLLSDGTANDVDPQYANNGGQIAFRSYRDDPERSTIYLMDAGGGGLRRVSAVRGDATNAMWSPDDALIAYQSDLDGDLDIYIYHVGSGETRLLTDNAIPDYAPTWKCNSDDVIFTSDVQGDPNIFEAEALPISAPALDVATETTQRTDDDADDIYPQGSVGEENASREGRLPQLEYALGQQTSFLNPDVSLTEADPSLERGAAWEALNGCAGYVCADWFLFHNDETVDWEIIRLNGAGSFLNLSNRSDAQDIAPSRSPNAEWVAFSSDRDGNREIYITPAEGGAARRVTFSLGVENDPVWSPTSDHIVYQSDRDGNWELYLFNIHTGQETRLTDDPAADLNASWSSGGGRLVFQSDRDGLWQIYGLDLGTLAVTRLSDGTANDSEPLYDHQGGEIAFRSDRDGHSALYLMNPDGSHLRRISDPAGSASHHAWYVDDSLLAYQSDLDGDQDIYVYDLHSGQTRQVTDNAIADYAPTWHCDSPTLIFNSEATGNPDIFETPALPIAAAPVAVQGEATQLTFDASQDLYPHNLQAEETVSASGLAAQESARGRAAQ